MIETENSSKSMIFSAISKAEDSENLVREQKKTQKELKSLWQLRGNN